MSYRKRMWHKGDEKKIVHISDPAFSTMDDHRYLCGKPENNVDLWVHFEGLMQDLYIVNRSSVCKDCLNTEQGGLLLLAWEDYE